MRPILRNEVYKEVNAHIRACDTQALAVNAAYSGVLLLAFTGRAPLFRDDFLEDKLGLSATAMGLISTLGLLAIGYLVLFIQLWLRAWKCHYAQVCHAMHARAPEEFGPDVPVWMREGVRFLGADILYRSMPFLVNVFLLFGLVAEGRYATGIGLPAAAAALAALLALHVALGYGLARAAGDLRRTSL